MGYPYLLTTILSGITGQFDGGNLAYVDGRYVLLDSTAASPRLIVLNSELELVRSVALPVWDGYVGVTFFGSSVVVLRKTFNRTIVELKPYFIFFAYVLG